MADPGMHDDGRDLRAALGGLLTDEPTAPWSVQDDVRRGQALRTRRRTRALGGVGIVAALVLLVGVLGPWRPAATHQAVASGVDNASVSDLLEQLGWTVTDVAEVRPGDADGPSVTTWSVSKGDGNINASLTVRTWDEASWPAGAGDPPGSVLAACGDACGEVSMSIPDCVGGPCWDWTSTTLTADADALPAGTGLMRSRSESERLVVELATSPASCATCTAVALPFLTQAEQTQVLELVQQQLLGATPTPEPPTPDPVAGRACTSNDVKLVAEIDPIPVPVGLTMLRIRVISRSADVACTLRGVPDVVPHGIEGVLRYDVQAGASGGGVALDGQGEAQFLVSLHVCAPVGGSLTFLRVTIAGGGEPLDVSVRGLLPLVSCAERPQANSSLLVSGFQPSDRVAPDPSSSAGPAGTSACTSDVVKLVPAVDSTGGATGERSVAIEVYARNPQISCVLDGLPTVVLQSGPDVATDVQYAEGLYQQGPQRRTGVIVDAEHAAVFVVAKSRCDISPVAQVDQLLVLLSSASTEVGVALPPGLGLELCGGVRADTGTVWVSAYTSRAGGVG